MNRIKIKSPMVLLAFIVFANYFNAEAISETADTITYTIHKERMDFIKKDVRPYLKQSKSVNDKLTEITEEQKSVEMHIKSGNENLAMQNYKAAVREYNLALDIDPNNAEALSGRANTKIKMNILTGAKSDYDQAIESDSESVELFFNRGNIKFELDDYEGALEDYSKAIHLNAKDKRIFFNRAVVEFHLGKKDLACKDFQKAAKMGDLDASSAALELCK